MSDDPTPPTEPERRGKYLLKPMLQLKVGIYHVILGTCFVFTLIGVLHSQWIRFRTWLELTELRTMIDSEVMAYVQSTALWVGLATIIFLGVSVVITILTTHRMVGPTVAFQRHIQALIAGNYDARTNLRPDDAFQEVAADLNALSEVLRKRHSEAADETPEPPSPNPAESEPSGEAS
jgi:methyl-accepting chemotaxis protein